jgi:hypothetical protein
MHAFDPRAMRCDALPRPTPAPLRALRVTVRADWPVIQMPYPTNGMQSAVNEGRAVIPEGMRVPMPDATERELGRATKFMSKKAWMRSLLGVQMATSAYGRLEPSACACPFLLHLCPPPAPALFCCMHL